MKIYICSKNPSKINGTIQAFSENFKDVFVEPLPSDSLVPDQPYNDEIFQGALNRINTCNPPKDYDYLVAIESGLQEIYGNNYIVQLSIIKDKLGNISSGISSCFPVPKKFKEKILATNLNNVICNIFKEARDSGKNGSIIKLTSGKTTRTDLCYQCVSMALVSFLNDKIWSDF